MSFFLFAKQIVDMLYAYKILDYGMVFFILLLLTYQLLLLRPSIKEFYKKTDVVVIVLAILVTFSFLKDISSYEIYFKVLSAFLMYFVGRIYYERIQECYGALVSSGYVVIYFNFIHRLKHFGGEVLRIKNAYGDLYYYDTDMAFAMIIAFIFVAMFGKNTVFKLFTILIICPYMVFFSDAGIQKILLMVIIGIIGLYIVELILRKEELGNVMLLTLIVGIIGVIILLYLPLFGLESNNILQIIFHNKYLDFENMDVRYTAWRELLQSCDDGHILEVLFGRGLQIKNHHALHEESLYLKIFYSLGWGGIFLSLTLLLCTIKYIAKIKDRKTFYLLIMMVIMLLGTGVTMNSMERVQMSWFPWMFAGMVISSAEQKLRRG